MPTEYIHTRRVEFCETDMAGIVHFSNFFRYMESAEHAFLRSIGFSDHATVDGHRIGWPRVRAEARYLRPLRFEDCIEIHLRVREKGRKILTYEFVLYRKAGEDREVVADGNLTVVCVDLDAQGGKMKSIHIPPSIADRIEPATASAPGQPSHPPQ